MALTLDITSAASTRKTIPPASGKNSSSFDLNRKCPGPRYIYYTDSLQFFLLEQKCKEIIMGILLELKIYNFSKLEFLIHFFIMKVYTQQYSQQTNDRAGFRSLSILMRLLEAFLKDISVAER